jgi:WD40 repeat protein
MLTSLAFTPDSTLLAVGSVDGSISMLRPRTPDQITRMFPAERPSDRRPSVMGVGFNTDGTRLAGAYDDGAIRLWDPHTRQEIGKPLISDNALRDGLTAMSFHSDRLLAAAYMSGMVRLWDTTTGKLVDSIDTTSSLVSPPALSVAVSHDGAIVAAAGADGGVGLWKRSSSGKLSTIGHPLRGHVGPVNALAFTSDDHSLVSVSDDQQMLTWDLTVFSEPEKRICRQLATNDERQPEASRSPGISC